MNIRSRAIERGSHARMGILCLLLIIVSGIVLLHRAGYAQVPAQPSPLETPTPTPFISVAETPTVFPVAPPPLETPSTTDIVPVEVATLPVESEPSPTPFETPTPTLILPALDRPVSVALPTPSPAFPELFAVILRSAARATAWIWFACGSLIFFIVAGIVAGLYLAQQNRNRYQIYTLVPDEQEDIVVERTEVSAKRNSNEDDIWPASLP